MHLGGASELPGYLWSGQFSAVDLYSEGLPGFLLSNDQSTLYWEPLGNGSYKAPVSPEQFPANKNMQGHQVAITDLDGGGYKSLVTHEHHITGFYQFNEQGKWETYQPFAQNATELLNPQTQHLDLNGNGLSDMAIFEDTYLRWYPSLGHKGYGEARMVTYPSDFPAVENTSEEVHVGFHNMNGDGLSDRVKVEDGCVTYWANKGYGCFAEATTMNRCPKFPNGLNTQYLHFADIDGSGTTDIIYLTFDKVWIWFNQSGNQFSEPITIDLPTMMPFDSISKVNFADILGNGTNCLVLTRIEPTVEHVYYEIVGRHKPYLLKGINNNCGATTKIKYTTSVKEYLKDKRKGRTPATQLFFPVQVVKQVETKDLISGAFHVIRHAYHDGYFDPYERKFRGFGFVESWDTMHYQEFAEAATADDQPTFNPQTVNEHLHVPPTYTKTWYHTGAYRKQEAIESTYQKEYYQGDTLAQSIPSNSFADVNGDTANANWESHTYRQAFAALKGQMLRSEVYGLDRTDKAKIPFTISESSVQVRLLQPRYNQRYAVLFPVVLETIVWHYERNPADPNIAHTFNLAIDEFGNHALACSVNYPRRSQSNNSVFPEQQEMHVVAHQTNFATKTETDCRWTGVAYEQQAFEIKTLNSWGAQWSYQDALTNVNNALPPNAEVIPNEQAFSTDNSPQARLLSHSRTLFWNDDQSDVGTLGALTSLNLHHHSETALGTGAFYASVYADKFDTVQDFQHTFIEEGGMIYDADSDYWWNDSPITYFHTDPINFYLPLKTENTRVGESSSLFVKSEVFCDEYQLFQTRSRVYLSDEVYLESSGAIDYQALQIWQATDVNGNKSEALFDAFGMAIVTTHYGQTMGEAEGNAPVAAYNLPSDASFDDVLSNPATYLQNASSYIYYDHLAWMTRREPACAISLVGEKYQSQLAAASDQVIQIAVAYSDGFGRMVETKHKTDAGPVQPRTQKGQLVSPSKIGSQGSWSNERWVVSGRTVYNNKGKPAQQYLSYFSDTPHYEDQATIEMDGLVPPPSILHYDALNRVVRTDTPKGFYSKVEFTPWLVKHYDANDTVLDSDYYQKYADLSEAEQSALDKAAVCQQTPTVEILDNLGRKIRLIKDNLGKVSPESFKEICQDSSLTHVQVNALLEKWGILKYSGWAVYYDWSVVVDFVQTHLAEIADGLLKLLYQARITTKMTYDIQGRNITTVDSRLFYNNVKNNTDDYNFLHTYNLTGQVVYTDSCDGGESWSLDDQFGKPIYSWDGRGFTHHQLYDRLQRPTKTTVTGGDLTSALDNVVALTVYGETLADAQDRNIRGKVYQVYDEAGLIMTDYYTIDGHASETTRKLRQNYKTEANWTPNAQQTIQGATIESFETIQAIDAIGKLLTDTLPDNTVLTPTYNMLGLVESLSVDMQGKGNPETIIKHIDYDVHNAPAQVQYGNGVTARMTYEETTQRLVRCFSYRMPKQLMADAILEKDRPREILQDIHYTYDPVGNIVQKVDRSFKTVFSNNQSVAPNSEYAYDPLYRLISATGRQLQHQGAPKINRKWLQNKGIPSPMPNPSDLQQLENYREVYLYDTENNLLGLHHHSGTTNWNRQFEISATSNRLVGNQASGQAYTYDGNGNLQNLDHLRHIYWDYRNNISQADMLLRSDAENPINDSEYYIYDGSGHRIRKVSERLIANGNIEVKDKIYLGNYQRTQTYIKNGDIISAVTKEKQTIKVEAGRKSVCLINQTTIDNSTSGKNNIGQAKFRYQLMDGDHSVSMEINENAEIITYEEYFPYGSTALVYGKNKTEIIEKEYRYSGEERDATGLYYYGARYYPPWLYRWLKPDPAGTVDGLNLYAFVGGSPVTHVDVGGFDRRKAKKRKSKKSHITPAIRKATNARKGISSRAKRFYGASKGVRSSTRIRERLQHDVNISDFNIQKFDGNEHTDSNKTTVNSGAGARTLVMRALQVQTANASFHNTVDFAVRQEIDQLLKKNKGKKVVNLQDSEGLNSWAIGKVRTGGNIPGRGITPDPLTSPIEKGEHRSHQTGRDLVDPGEVDKTDKSVNITRENGFVNQHYKGAFEKFALDYSLRHPRSITQVLNLPHFKKRRDKRPIEHHNFLVANGRIIAALTFGNPKTIQKRRKNK
ncbi:MAG: toxin TcdB middle/C-terminal domain-containing protein [Bacteroidota bacterium]